MRVDHPQAVDEVLFLDRGRRAALAAALLRAIGRGRLALGVAGVRQRHHHVLGLDQVEDVEVFLAGADLGAARVAEFFHEVAQFGADHVQQHVRVLEDVDQAADRFQQLRYSSVSFSCSSPVRRFRRISRISFACISVRR